MAGQYKDDESGLFYNWHRFYVPELGRYNRVDDLGLYDGANPYNYVGSNVLSATDPTGLLQKAVKDCVCDFMRNSNYNAAMAWSSALQVRQKNGRWNTKPLRPCENYLYAFAAITDYGDPSWLISLGVDFHAIRKLIPVGTSPFDMEAYLAGQEGVKDAQNNKDWRQECENGQC